MCFGQPHALRNDFPQPVVQQTAFRGIMNVRFHHERIGADLFDRSGIKRVSCTDDGLVDACDGFRSQESNVVADGSPFEGPVIAVADSHDGAQLAVIFSKVLQLIVGEVATQSHGCQHTDMPVFHPRSTCVGATVTVNVGGDPLQNVIDKPAVRIQELQSAKNGNDAIPRFQI
ncbi:hypothetical protein Pan161_46850 [Gimesia algae]|uniref:Uncharacterized protein n=1 Tax=Gimesia algae TaxID=2527971 RepID=A0A517VJ35_9PLAN|nr:hypothetical protein Pan161_46850 [Gimesia algae]